MQFCVATIQVRCLLSSGQKMKKSTASRKVEWLLMPGSQHDTAMLATVTDIPSSRNLTPLQMLKRMKMGWRRMNLF